MRSPPSPRVASGMARPALASRREPKPRPALREALPELLWIVQMVITLGWVQDLSPGKKVTRSVVGRLTPSLARLLGLVRLAPFRPFVEDALEGLAAVKEARQDSGSQASIGSAVPVNGGR